MSEAYKLGYDKGNAWQANGADYIVKCPYLNDMPEYGSWHRGFLDGVWDYISKAEKLEEKKWYQI